jgi:hypothetical protein
VKSVSRIAKFFIVSKEASCALASAIARRMSSRTFEFFCDFSNLGGVDSIVGCPGPNGIKRQSDKRHAELSIVAMNVDVRDVVRKFDQSLKPLGRDVLSACRFYEVFFSICDPQVTLFVEFPDVPRPKPTVLSKPQPFRPDRQDIRALPFWISQVFRRPPRFGF